MVHTLLWHMCLKNGWCRAFFTVAVIYDLVSLATKDNVVVDLS